MLSGKPSVLRLPEERKEELLMDIEEAIDILNRRVKDQDADRYIDEQNYDEFFETMDHASFLMKYCLPLIIGRTQQRFVKRYPRAAQVHYKCLEISMETGFPEEEIYLTFISFMRDYIA